MAIVTVSRQYGSRGDELARELAGRTGFRLVTQEVLEETIRAQYGVEPPAWESSQGSGNGDGHASGNGRAAAQWSLYADLAATAVAELAMREHLALVGWGGQFLFREAPCALHLRVVAPRAWRAAAVAAQMGLPPPAAAELVARRDAEEARFLRTVFGGSAQHSDLYHLVLNTAALDFDHALDLALAAMDAARLRQAGLLPAEAAQRAKVRSKMRLARRFAQLPGSLLLERVAFAHPSERVFARLMDFYGIEWEYESRTFPIGWNQQMNVVEAFTPDFYLPELDLYVELTTMKQSLVTRKNHKVKRLRELYPQINIRIFYQKDVEDLIFKLGAPKLVA